MNEIWIEKYRPKALKDIVGQRDIIDRLESYVQVRNLPHLMFAGPAGTGKTTSAIALAKSLYGDNWKANFNELNASDERGIDVVRGKIKDFARTAPIGGAEFKIIFLDEADALTADAQSALRRTMERYSKTCRFILSCVTPDTTILLSEDREIEIGDFMRKFENREIKNTLGLNEGGKALENDLVLFGMQMSPSANGKRVYELTTMSGRVLKVTEDHPILTNEGWTTVSEIVPGTKVVVYPHLEGTPLEEDPRQVIDVDDLKKFLSDKESDGREGDGEHGGSTTARWDDVGNGMRYLRPLVPQGKGSTVREIKEVNDLNDKDRQVWRKDIGDPIDLKKTSTCRIAQSIERKRFVDRAVDGKIRSFRAIEQQHRNERDFRGIRGSIEPESSMEMASAPVERHAVGTTIPKGTTDEVITELAEMGLLPLAYSDEHIGALTRIVAFLLAGGNVPTERDGLLFVGREDVLSAVRKDLETLHVECSELEGMEKEDDLSDGHLAGKTTWFCADSQPFALLCEYLGAPCGYKTKTRLSVPSWVSNGTRFVKREFLRALFGCCGDEPSLDGKNNFHAISFRQCSVPELRGETLAFLEQLKNLLSQFNIVGFIEESRTGYEGGRNGRMPIIFSLVLDTSHDNLLAFFKQVGYAYDKGKIRKAQLAGEYLKYRSFAVDRQRTKAEQVLLEIVGHSQREISGEYAGGPGPVASNNPGEPSHLPHDLMDYSEWVMRYDIPGTELVLNEIICKREMECDDVRDIGCLKNHNFIANGIVSHNCNYSSKIIEPIQSRCAVFRFRPLRAEDVHKYLHQIVTSENLTITEDALEALVHVSQGDMRKAINSLQVAASLGENITVEVVYHTTGTARPEEVRDLLQTAISGDFIAARNRLDDIMISYGLSGEDIIRQIHRTVFDLDIPDYEKVKLMDRTGEIEFRMVEGANERIQLESLLAYMVLVGEHRGDSAD